MKNKDLIILFEKLKCRNDIDIDEFYNVLKECNALKNNYRDYLITSPLNCDEELLQISTADYDKCCALLTKLLREDYFINGSFMRRQQSGHVKQIVERMIVFLKSNNQKRIYTFSEKALEALNGFYVYALVDPRNNMFFYVGKGTGNRVFSHEIESNKSLESEKIKLKKIREIEKSGFCVKKLIVNWGLSEKEAFIAEATLINMLHCMNNISLTNEVAGHHVHNGMTVEEFELQYGAVPLRVEDIKHSILIIKINKLYRRGMSPSELYDTVRGFWTASLKSIRAKNVKYVFGVYNGIIVAVYKPDEWHYGYEMKDIPQREILKTEDYDKIKKRVYFICKDYESIDDEGSFYLNKSIMNLKINQSAQNPVTYLLPETKVEIK